MDDGENARIALIAVCSCIGASMFELRSLLRDQNHHYIHWYIAKNRADIAALVEIILTGVSIGGSLQFRNIVGSCRQPVVSPVMA